MIKLQGGLKHAHLTGGEPAQVQVWAKRLVDDLNRKPDYVSSLPSYTDDAAAETAGLPIGAGYVDAAGLVRRRIV